jgi:hypothetical protein
MSLECWGLERRGLGTTGWCDLFSSSPAVNIVHIQFYTSRRLIIEKLGKMVYNCDQVVNDWKMQGEKW